MEDQRKDNLEQIGSANKHRLRILEVTRRRFPFPTPITIIIAAGVGLFISLVVPNSLGLTISISLTAALLIILTSKVRKGFQCDKSGFTILDYDYTHQSCDWDDVESFGFTQLPFGNGILDISLKEGKSIRLQVRTPEFDPNVGRIIELLESNVSVSKPRHFKLFRKGQHFQENSIVAISFLIPGATLLVSGLIIGLFPILEPLSKLSTSILLCGLGFSISGIGLDILFRVLKPPLKNSLSEPIIYSKLPDRLTKIISVGSMFFVIWIVAAIVFAANSLYSAYFPLLIATALTLIYNIRPTAWSSFEEVVVTEGRIRIRKFRKVYEAYVNDVNIEIIPNLLLDRIVISTDVWKIEIGDHIVAGEKLSKTIEKLKQGQSIRPILSEEHPGFKFEYNDAD